MTRTQTVPFGTLAIGARFQFLTGVDAIKLDATCARVTGGNFSFIDRPSATEPVVPVDGPLVTGRLDSQLVLGLDRPAATCTDCHCVGDCHC